MEIPARNFNHRRFILKIEGFVRFGCYQEITSYQIISSRNYHIYVIIQRNKGLINQTSGNKTTQDYSSIYKIKIRLDRAIAIVNNTAIMSN